MTTASILIYKRLGCPVVGDAGDLDPFTCWVCASPGTRGKPVSTWLGNNFVGQNRVRCPESRYVCEACIYVMGGRPPSALRCYSHLIEDGGEYLKLNKADKPRMREFLRRPHALPWAAAISDSGKKHVANWTPINPGGQPGGRVLFEETYVDLPRTDAGWGIIDDLTSLLTAGATKGEIEVGDYSARAYELCAERLRAFETKWSGARHGAWFTLALWLAQRDEQLVAERLEREKIAKAEAKAKSKTTETKPRAKRAPRGREKEDGHDRRKDKRETPNVDSRTTFGDSGRIPADTGQERHEALVDPRGADASLGSDERGPRNMVNTNGSVPKARGAQLNLF